MYVCVYVVGVVSVCVWYLCVCGVCGVHVCVVCVLVCMYVLTCDCIAGSCVDCVGYGNYKQYMLTLIYGYITAWYVVVLQVCHMKFIAKVEHVRVCVVGVLMILVQLCVCVCAFLLFVFVCCNTPTHSTA